MENQNVVVAEYLQEHVWRVPLGVDLNDTTQVSRWYVRWSILHIEYADGRAQEINMSCEWEPNYKHPSKVRIENENVHNYPNHKYDELGQLIFDEDENNENENNENENVNN